MSAVPPATRDERLRRYLAEGRAVPMAARCRALALATSASADVEGLVLAVSPAATEREFDLKVQTLREHLGRQVDPVRRAHVAALAEAALASENGRRMSTGMPPYGLRIGGWLDELPTVLPHEVDRRPPDIVVPPAASRSAEVVDEALGAAIVIVADLIGLPAGGAAKEGAYRVVERVAFTICAEPGTRDDADDRRRTCVILARTLRRRRLAVAVVRACLVEDRRRFRSGMLE